MPTINKVAILNPFTDLTADVTEYVPRATTSTFGVVAIGSGINVDSLGRIYLDTQEYSDRLAAIEAEAASTLTTQKSEVAAAIAQVNLTQSQTITALTLEVSNLKTNLTDTVTTLINSATTAQTELVNRADQLAQDVTDITVQLTQDKATFTQEIQDALDYLKDDASVASALRTPRKIQTVPFDGTQDINLPIFTSEIAGLVPKREGTTSTKYLREDGTWVVPPDTAYALLTKASAEDGTATSANSISAKVLKDAIKFHAPPATNITGNAGTATKLQTPRTINGVLFDGTQNISLPEAVAYSLPTASDSVVGGIKVGSGLVISNSVLSVGTLNQSTTGNAATATKLQTARTIGGVSFDGTTNINLPGVNTAGNQSTSGNAATATKLQTARSIAISGAVTGTATSFDGSANIAIATTAIDGSKISTGTIPAAQIPTLNQSTTGNAGSATKLQTARLINGIAFDGTGDINLDVYNKSEVDTAIANATPTTPNATEAVAGKAKIATTAIAQAGVNDTDFITAKKLRDALNAEGDAPVYAIRAIAQGNSDLSFVFTRKLNISTASRINSQVLSFTFTTAMPDSNYNVLGFGSDQAIGVEGRSGSLTGFDQTTTGFKVKYTYSNHAVSQSINSFRLVVL